MKRIKQIAVYSFCTLLAVFTSSCGETHIHEIVNRTKTIEIQTEVIVKKVRGNNEFRIIKIDGCEYIAYSKDEMNSYGDPYAFSGLCHKANCKNH